MYLAGRTIDGPIRLGLREAQSDMVTIDVSSEVALLPFDPSGDAYVEDWLEAYFRANHIPYVVHWGERSRQGLPLLIDLGAGNFNFTGAYDFLSRGSFHVIGIDRYGEGIAGEVDHRNIRMLDANGGPVISEYHRKQLVGPSGLYVDAQFLPLAFADRVVVRTPGPPSPYSLIILGAQLLRPGGELYYQGDNTHGSGSFDGYTIGAALRYAGMEEVINNGDCEFLLPIEAFIDGVDVDDLSILNQRDRINSAYARKSFVFVVPGALNVHNPFTRFVENLREERVAFQMRQFNRFDERELFLFLGGNNIAREAIPRILAPVVDSMGVHVVYVRESSVPWDSSSYHTETFPGNVSEITMNERDFASLPQRSFSRILHQPVDFTNYFSHVNLFELELNSLAMAGEIYIPMNNDQFLGSKIRYMRSYGVEVDEIADNRETGVLLLAEMLGYNEESDNAEQILERARNLAEELNANIVIRGRRVSEENLEERVLEPHRRRGYEFAISFESTTLTPDNWVEVADQESLDQRISINDQRAIMNLVLLVLQDSNPVLRDRRRYAILNNELRTNEFRELMREQIVRGPRSGQGLEEYMERISRVAEITLDEMQRRGRIRQEEAQRARTRLEELRRRNRWEDLLREARRR